MKNQIVTNANQNLQEISNNFLSYLDVRGKSVETYSIALRQFFKWIDENNIKQPTREDIIEYREELKGRVKPNTIQSYLIAIRQFFKWTASVNIYPNICDNVKGVKIDNIHKRDALTLEQAKRVMASITSIRDYALLSLMVTCGLRTIEVERANICDLRTISGMNVLFIQGKGRDEKSEFVKIPDQVLEAINKYLELRNDKCEALFVSESKRTNSDRLVTRSIRYIVKQYFRDNDLNSDRLSAHSLRHTAGTLALMSGSSLEEVQQMLRHNKLDTTMIYLHHLERVNNNSECNVANAIFN